MKKILIYGMLFLTCGCYAQKSLNNLIVDQKILPVSDNKVIVYTTANSGNNSYRLNATDTLQFFSFFQPLETQPCVFLDPDQTFQTFLGIGGALTDASAETFAKLSTLKQEEILKAYYDSKNGIGYTLGRTNIHSCDFSSASYTYVKDNDSALKTFTVKHDEQFRIPLIKRAMEMSGGNLKLYASPWSPPAWMKDNNSMLHGGKLLPRYYQSWANYYVKFITEYEKAGIPVWGITVQNEPMANQTWESCIFSAQDECDFIKNYLGPTLYKNGMADKKLLAWDHNRDLMYHRANIILKDPQASKYIWGIGYHWYETWTGSSMQFENVEKVKETYPSKNLLFTEGCIEKFNFSKINDWSLGEKYGHSMIGDFNAGTVGWTDWNILLDETGGPNHVGNFCFSPIIADTKTSTLYYTNIYYYIGHFSKFIKPGAISTSNFMLYPY